jgi:hypothetical protein
MFTIYGAGIAKHPEVKQKKIKLTQEQLMEFQEKFCQRGEQDMFENLRLLGFLTLSIIGYSKEHNLIATGSVSILR